LIFHYPLEWYVSDAKAAKAIIMHKQKEKVKEPKERRFPRRSVPAVPYNEDDDEDEDDEFVSFRKCHPNLF